MHLYMSELGKNKSNANSTMNLHMKTSDHKIVRRHLNQIDHDVKDGKSINDICKADALPPVHQHTADRPRELGSELGHKHSDTTHSAIGINKYILNYKELYLFYLGVTLNPWFCIYVNY